jgi:GrpB-like predicted nucleotidyltransferase (UPF0157 family)
MAELDEPIHLCPYDPKWPALFASEARRILAALPADVSIEHIGSTSVPGLVAKPIIDIMLGLARTHRDLDTVRTTLTNLGYEDMGEAGVPGRLYFRRRAETAFNVALVTRGGSVWIANLALREYLRTHPEAAREYADTKRAAVGERSYIVARLLGLQKRGRQPAGQSGP